MHPASPDIDPGGGTTTTYEPELCAVTHPEPCQRLADGAYRHDIRPKV